VLFGCHVARGTDHLAGLGHLGASLQVEGVDDLHRLGIVELGARPRLGPRGEAEVDELGHPFIVEHDVVGLDVAVDQTRGMNGTQPGRHAVEKREDVLAGSRCVGQPVRQRAAGQVLHHDVDMRPVALDQADVVDRHHALVRQRCERPRFPEDLAVRRIGPRRRQADHLDRDVTAQLRIVGEQHGAERTPTKSLDDVVAPLLGILGAPDQRLCHAGHRQTLVHLDALVRFITDQPVERR